MTNSRIARLLRPLGLERRDLRAWALWDWANSAFTTTIVAAVFPIYFSSVAAAGMPAATATFRFSLATTLALVIVALIAPVLGAVADVSGRKKRFLAAFQLVAILATLGLTTVTEGDWLVALVFFAIGNVGAAAAFVFYDSLLPHLTSGRELHVVSTAGYAVGYLGGGLLLALNLLWIQQPQWFGLPDGGAGVRLSFLSVAVWWALFSIPLFRRVPEPPARREADEPPGAGTIATAFTRLGETFRSISDYRDAFLMLAAFLLYSDGINTVIRMATIFGAEIGIEQQHLIGALLLVQFVGVPFAFLFGRVASGIGARTAIFIALAVYVGICILAFFMRTAAHFYGLAVLVAMVQGGSLALSRSLFASMIPRHKSSEFFGLFSALEKFAGILGPAVFTVTVGLTASSRHATLAVASFFIVGALILWRVDVEKGQRVAREVEDALSPGRPR